MFRFIPNTPVVTWGQKPTTGQLSDFINGRIGGKILNFGAAPVVRKAELGALYMPKSDKGRFLAQSRKNL